MIVPFTFDHKLGGSADMKRPPSLTFFEDETNSLTSQPNAVAFHATQDPISDADAPSLGASASIGVHQGLTVRRLTPLERERLMGWPDGWTAWGIGDQGERVEMSDTVRDRLTGNGVVTPVARWIADRIVGVERGEVDTSRSTPSEPTLSRDRDGTPTVPLGPQSPPVAGPARTVEVSDRTGRTDPDVP